MAVSADLANRLGVALASGAARDEMISALGITTFGNVYYVWAGNKSDGTPNGLDTNDGLSMTTALATVEKADSKMASNGDDWCVMSSNSPHALSTELATSGNRKHFLGLGPFRSSGQRCRWEMGVTTGSEVGLVQNTGNGNTFHNIKMRSVDTNSSYAFADGGEHTMLDHVALEHAALLTTDATSELLCNGDTAVYQDCTIGNTIYQINATRQGVQFATGTISGKAARDVNFKRCTFLVDSADTTYAFLRATTADIQRYCLIKDSTMITSLLSSATVDEGCAIASALTQGVIVFQNTFTNATHMVTVSSNGFTHGPAAHADGSILIEAS